METINEHPKAEPTSNAEKAPENWTTKPAHKLRLWTS